MQDRYYVRRNPRRQMLVRNADLVDQDGNLVTQIPTQEQIQAARRQAAEQQLYQQALQVMVTTPELDRRMRYISASMIVSVLGGWLAAQAMRTRAFVFVVDVLIFLFSITVVGLLVGLMIGFGVLPVDTIPILLIIGTVVVLFVAIAVFLAMIMLVNHPHPQVRTVARPDEVDYVVTEEPRTYRNRVNRS